jgi:hypothetical protein
VVYLSNGDGTFQGPLVSGGNIPPHIRSLVVGDFDGDGNLDVAAASDCLSNQDCSAGSITILLGNGQGTFTQSAQYPLNGIVSQPNTLALGDFNGDGKLDLVVGIACYSPQNSCSIGGVSVYPGNGDGTLGVPTSYTTISNSGVTPVVGDFNGDGRLDVVAGFAYYSGYSALMVLLGNGDGTFSWNGSLATFPFSFSALTAADFNTDGKLDLAISTYPASILILSGKGDGTFQSPVQFSSTLNNEGTNITAIAATDLNNDGNPDLVISGTLHGNNAVQLFLNDGTGNFVSGPTYGLGGWELAPIVAQDFNGDGNKDIVMASFCSEDGGIGNHCSDGTLSILLGNGNGTMQGPTILSQNPVVSQFNSAITADINGDGIPDLIQTSSTFGQDYSQGGVIISLGTGNGNYGPATAFPTGSPVAFWVFAGDFNGDGKIDLAVANECWDSSCTQGGVAILLGNGDGTFQAPKVYSSGSPYSLMVVAGDFKGDGKLGVALMNQVGPPSITILLGNGDGTLQPAVLTDTSAGVSSNYSIALGDFNRDGKTDVALLSLSTDQTAGLVRIYISNGDGTLTQVGASYSSGGRAAGTGIGFNGLSLSVGDVNGDGNLDVVAANGCQQGDSSCAYGSLSVLLGNGDGTFKTGSLLTVPDGNFFSLLLADVNGDGILDAIAANLTGVAVFPGNRDGSFQAPTVYAGLSTGGRNMNLAMADLNIIQPWLSAGVTAVFVNKAGTYLVSTSSTNPSATSQALTLTTTVSSSYLKGLTPTGIISYYDGSASLGSAALVGGVATFNVATALTQGVHTIASYYSGDSNFAAHAGTPILQVVTAGTGVPTNTAIAAPAINYGAAAHVTVAVTSGQGTVTGNVTLTVDNASPVIQTLSGSSTVFTISGLAGGSHSLSASYAAQGTFASSSATGTQTVNPATSSVVLASSGSPTIWGQNVTFTVSITPQNGGVATGTVNFSDGATVLATVNVAGNAAVLPITTLGAGSHSVTATYSGDSNVAGGSSSTISQLVNQSTTTATIASSADPSYLGQAVTFTATVTGQQGGAVSGNVAFKQGATTVATVGLVSGQAVYSTTYATTGTRSMTVVYAGDSNNLGSTSAVLKQAVQSLPAATTTKVVTSGSPSLINQLVTFTATVSSTDGVPDNEAVTFYDGATAIGTGLTSGGLATFQTSSLTAKTHTIKATYAGDATFKSSSGTVSQVVSLYTATVTLTASPNPSAYGQSVGLIATVTSGAPGGPTGTVTFKNGSTTLGTAPLTGETALLATTKLPVGSDAVTAIYNGDAQDGKMTSAPFTQAVNPAMINMTFTSSPNPSTFGKAVKFTATLTSNGKLPNGQTVTFGYNGTNLGTGNISGGKAVFSTTTLPAGSDGVTATYAGSADYSPASASVTQTVN